MAGLFDFLSNEDPNQAAQLAMAAGLLGGRGSFNEIVGKSLLAGQAEGQRAGAIKRQAQLDALAKQRFQLALDEEQRKKQAYDAQEKFRRSIQSPDMVAAQTALAGGGGPTLANAANMPPVSPDERLMHGALQAGAMTPMEYLASRRKDTTPITLAPGAKLLKAGTYQELASNPKEDTQDPFVRLLIQSGIDPKSEQGVKLLQQRAIKEATHPEPISMNNYGSPLPVQVPGGTGYLAPPTRPGAPSALLQIPGTTQPALKPAEAIPASTRKDIAENNVALAKVNEALDLLSKNPTAVGGHNLLPDELMQRIDPRGVATRASISDIGSQKIHDRSGANVTVSEAPRLKPFVPTVKDTPEAARIKLERFKSEYEAMGRELAGGASIAETIKPHGIPKVRKYNPDTGKIE